MKTFLWIYFSGLFVTLILAFSLWIKEYKRQRFKGFKTFLKLLTEEEVRIPMLVSFASWIVILFIIYMFIQDEYDYRKYRRNRWNCNFDHLNQNDQNGHMDVGS